MIVNLLRYEVNKYKCVKLTTDKAFGFVIFKLDLDWHNIELLKICTFKHILMIINIGWGFISSVIHT